MNKLHSVTAFAVLLSLQFCEHDPEVDLQAALVVKTINGSGKPVPAELVYESRDCEYDFSEPKRITSNREGISILKGLSAGPVQLYAEGFLYESYQCYHYQGGHDTLTIYAAPIPTYISVTDKCGNPVPEAVVRYFVNEAGDCDYQEALGNEVITDNAGKAVIYLPQGNTFKIQLVSGKSREIQCYQPSQMPETVSFVVPCR